MQVSGLIFDIKKYSINDGPGIRTTIFFKGCPLNCWWCHNPESRASEPEEFSGRLSRWNPDFENMNRNVVGRKVTTANVMKEIEKDIPFYQQSKGGVTFSGGEPMLQIDFLSCLLEKCKLIDINTAVDTTGYSDYKNYERIYETTDYFLYDLKLMDDHEHIKYTGASNKIIHENLRRLTSAGNKVILRIPIIPTITNTSKNIDEMVNFISSLEKVREIDLLPFHKSANSKYEKMKKENKLPNLVPLNEEEIEFLREKFSKLGYPLKIGG
ncbi:MAG: glycyl-radical enzyme activating protein [Ignavibacteriaceae bacterium]|nr:glycyl-radical enzyme activating protein [Ignavibacteriaceae bacterium]